MKLAAVMKVIAPFLATDKKPEEVLAAVLAADKKGKDSLPGNVGEAKEIEGKDKAAKDRKAAHDKARDAMSEDEKKAFDAMSDEEKDKAAEDRDDDPESTNDEDVSCGDPSSPGGSRAGGKTAIDSAEVDRRIANAVAARDALHTALREVEPIVGVIAADSAGAAYKVALDKLGVDTKGVPTSAFRALLTLAKDKAATPATTLVAMDSAGVAALDKVIPGYSRLRG